jgi:WD40 repeat protein
MDDLTGRSIKGYELRAKLGAGGFGAVYRAHQSVVERDVAIKVILPQYANHPEFIRRFESEAQLVARLEHLHIVPLHDYWRDPDGAYLVMRLLQGGSLRSKLERLGSLDPTTTADILDQIASALMVAHRRKVVHRDLKPDNVLLDEEGNAYLADFGIAKDISISPTAADSEFIVGSPTYLSPEQILGNDITGATDIYSLGVMLYELLTGSAPFAGSTAGELINKHLYETVPPIQSIRPDLPETIDVVIQKAIKKTPSQRYQDAQSLAVEFRQAVQTVQQPQDTDAAQRGADSLDLAMESKEKRVTPPEPRYTDMVNAVTFAPGYAAIPTILGVIPGWGIDNPYKGLRAFQEADAEDFYGRESLVEQLIARMSENDSDGVRFLAVVGPSGSGKSSVVRAGLIPALRQGKLPNSQYWFVTDMIPGPRPFEELGAALLQVAINTPPDLAQQLTDDPRGLLRVIEQILPEERDTELVLVIDQFEELFTLLDNENDRALFLDSLLHAVSAPQSRLRLLVTLRADFYDRPLLYPEFGNLVRKRTEVILPLTGAELERVITKPVEQIGIGLEQGLLDAILADIAEQPGALPLLQYALTELFERRQNDQLTLSSYRESGGVLGALARRADELYQGLDKDSRDAARQLFLRLVNLGEGTEDTRRRVQRTELPAIQGNTRLMDQVIDSFARYRLLTVDRDPITRRPTVEVAHEALIRTWEPLREWLRSSREDLQMQRRMEAAAAEWVSMGHDASFLASGARLEQFEQWAKETTLALSPTEATYLRASVEDQVARRAADDARKARELRIAQRAQTFGRAAAVLAVVGVLAVIATGAAIVQSTQAQNQVFVAGQTLTPVPPTLTAVQSALNLGNSQLATATVAQGQARREADAAQTQIVDSFRTLTPIAQQIALQQTNLKALSLAASSIRELSSSYGNPEVAALLAIRSLQLTYDPVADSGLMQALDQTYTLRRFAHKDYVGSVVYSPDGKYAATGCNDRVARIWEVATGKEVQQFSGHSDGVVSVAFSPDGKYLLTGSKDSTTRLWEVATGKEIRQFAGPPAAVRGVAFSPDGSKVLAGGEDNTARVWETATGAALQRFVGHAGPIWSVAFSPDGKTALTGSWDLTARLWDVETGTEIRQFRGHTNYVWSVAFSPDGSNVLTSSVDSSARLWETATGKELHQFLGHSEAVWAASFSPDGKTILTAGIDFTARLWDRASGVELRRLRGHTDVIYAAAFAPDGKTVLTASRDQSARLWTVQPGKEMRQLTDFAGPLSTVSYSYDGKTILTSSYDGTVRLWDAASLQTIRQFKGHTREVVASAFAPNGKTILTGSADLTARLWNVETGKELKSFVGHSNFISAVAYSPDSALALTGGYDGVAILWDLSTGTERGRFILSNDPNNAITSVAYSPDGKHALISGLTSMAALVDVVNGKVVFPLSGHENVVMASAFSPDGKVAVTGSIDRTARLWDVATGKEIGKLVGHTDTVHAVIFSRNGRLILTGSDDHTIKVWDAATGKEIRQLSGHAGPVLSLSTSPDDKMIVSGSNDKTVRLWDVDSQDSVSFACTRLVRDLTTTERQKFGITDQLATCKATP